MPTPPLPVAIRSRSDLDDLLARATNYEERLPQDLSQRAFDLSRMSDLLRSLGDPHLGFAPAHVAGTKGKGSTCRMIDAALRAAGRGPVGLYTSPHLSDLAERFAVDGRSADDGALARAADRLLPWVRETQGTDRAPTFFEAVTAMAWLVFREAGCREVVLEVGLGGRLDATNVCRPAATAVTSIEREHTRILGDSVEAIAGEKAGILKPGVFAATSAEGAALAVVERRAAEVGAPLAVVGREVRVLDARTGPGPRTAARLAFEGGGLLVEMPVAGAHHATNAAVAALVARSMGVPDEAIRAGLATLRLPGVVEPLARDPVLVVDGAHTPASAARTRDAVAACWPDRPAVVLLGVMEDKDLAGIVDALAPLARRVIATSTASPRAAPAESVAAAARSRGASADVVEGVPAAVERARERAGRSGLVLVTGSVHLAGAVRSLYLSSIP